MLTSRPYNLWCRFPKWPIPLYTQVHVDTLSVDAFRNEFLHLTRQFAIEKDSINLLKNGNICDDKWLRLNYVHNSSPDDCFDFHVENLDGQRQVYEKRIEWIKRVFLVPVGEIVTLGMFINKRPLCAIDKLPVVLDLLDEKLRTRDHMLLIAWQWKALTDGEDPDFSWRDELVEENGNVSRRYPILQDSTVLDCDLTAAIMTLLTGEAQSGKSIDIAVLNWVLPRLGFLVAFSARKKNGEATISSIRQFFDKMSAQGETLYTLLNNGRRPTTDTKKILSSTVLDLNLAGSINVNSVEIGKWESAYIIAGLQTQKFSLQIGFAFAKCLGRETCKTARIADEDDEVVGSFDANGSNVEKFAKKESIINAMFYQLDSVSATQSKKFLDMLNKTSLQIREDGDVDLSASEDDVEEPVDSLQQKKQALIRQGFDKSFRQFVDVDIRITSTGIACLHNNYETTTKVNVLVKPVPSDYHGFGVGHNVLWKDIPKTGKLDGNVEKRSIKEIITSAFKDAQQPYFRAVATLKSITDLAGSYVRTKANDEKDLKTAKRELKNFIKLPILANENGLCRTARVQEVFRKLDSLRRKRINGDAFYYSKPGVDRLFDDAVVDYNSQLFSHVNVLLASGKWTRMQPMELVCEKSVKQYGSTGLPVIGFVYNSDRYCNMYFSIAENSAFHGKNFQHAINLLETNFNKYITKGSTILDLKPDVACLKIKLASGKHRSTHLYYDFALYLNSIFGSPKPFVVCVSGSMAERQAIFKDSNHIAFVTHMLVSFNNKDQTTIIQKVGRICGRDPHFHIPRKLYCDKSTWDEIQKALTLYRQYMAFFASQRGKTVGEALMEADDTLEATFKEMMSEGRFHRVKYAKEMNKRVPELLDPAFRQHVENTDFPLPKLDGYTDNATEGTGVVDANLDYITKFEGDLLAYANAIDPSTLVLTAGRNCDTWKFIAAHFTDRQTRTIRRGWVQLDDALVAQTQSTRYKTKEDFISTNMRNVVGYWTTTTGRSWRAKSSGGRHLEYDANRGTIRLAWDSIA